MQMCTCKSCLFSCGEVGQLFCRVEQQLDKVIHILTKVRYDNDALLVKLEQLLTDLRQHYITLHLQQFVLAFISVLLNASEMLQS